MPTSATCHPHKPAKARGLCRNCYERDLLSRNLEYRNRQRSNTARWVSQNPERKAVFDFEHHLLSTYGLAQLEYDAMLVKQGGVCAICKRPPRKNRLNVDHCHRTGRIRGLLCISCNRACGYLDNSAWLHKATAYLGAVVTIPTLEEILPFTDLGDYPELAYITADYPMRGSNLLYPALGLVGEAGEAADKIKKLWRNHGKTAGGQLTEQEKQELAKEIGDVLWYVNALAHELQIPLVTIAEMNLRKLYDRHARGVIKSEGDNR